MKIIEILKKYRGTIIIITAASALIMQYLKTEELKARHDKEIQTWSERYEKLEEQKTKVETRTIYKYKNGDEKIVEKINTVTNTEYEVKTNTVTIYKNKFIPKNDTFIIEGFYGVDSFGFGGAVKIPFFPVDIYAGADMFINKNKQEIFGTIKFNF